MDFERTPVADLTGGAKASFEIREIWIRCGMSVAAFVTQPGGISVMTFKVPAIAAGIGLLVAVLPALAHHQFSAEYDASKPVTLKGTLTKMDWVNPHGWIYIDVRDPETGKAVNWAIQLSTPNALHGQGLRKTDLPPGLEMVVKGYRARNNASVAVGGSITLPDGRTFVTSTVGSGFPTDGIDTRERRFP